MFDDAYYVAGCMLTQGAALQKDDADFSQEAKVWVRMTHVGILKFIRLIMDYASKTYVLCTSASSVLWFQCSEIIESDVICVDYDATDPIHHKSPCGLLFLVKSCICMYIAHYNLDLFLKC